MPRIKEFVSTNTFRADEKGYSAFETLGRRVGGQYDQAGNDLRDVGRAQAAVTQMIGRWPFNIIELERREAEREAAKAAPARGGSSGFSIGGARRGSDPWARRMPDLAALNQMSEGAGAFGRFASRYVGGTEGEIGSSTRSDRDGYSAQTLRERDRRAQLDYLARQKSWDAYQKGLGEYNEKINEDADKSVEGILGQPVGISNDENSPYFGTNPDYGGTWTPEDTTEYGGGQSWANWLGISDE